MLCGQYMYISTKSVAVLCVKAVTLCYSFPVLMIIMMWGCLYHEIKIRIICSIKLLYKLYFAGYHNCFFLFLCLFFVYASMVTVVLSLWLLLWLNVVFVVKRTSSQLTIGCFTFAKYAISEAPYESIRTAGLRRGRLSGSAGSSPASASGFSMTKRSPDSGKLVFRIKRRRQQSVNTQ